MGANAADRSFALAGFKSWACQQSGEDGCKLSEDQSVAVGDVFGYVATHAVDELGEVVNG